MGMFIRLPHQLQAQVSFLHWRRLIPKIYLRHMCGGDDTQAFRGKDVILCPMQTRRLCIIKRRTILRYSSKLHRRCIILEFLYWSGDMRERSFLPVCSWNLVVFTGYRPIMNSFRGHTGGTNIFWVSLNYSLSRQMRHKKRHLRIRRSLEN